MLTGTFALIGECNPQLVMNPVELHCESLELLGSRQTCSASVAAYRSLFSSLFRRFHSKRAPLAQVASKFHKALFLTPVVAHDQK